MAKVQRSIVSAFGPEAHVVLGVTYGGAITYTELIDGVKETFTPELLSASKTVDVSYLRRREFLATMLGYTTANVAGLQRVLPQQYNANGGPGFPVLYCTGADLLTAYGAPRPTTNVVGTDGGDILFDTARYMLTYQSPRYVIRSDSSIGGGLGAELNRYVERDVQFAADNIPVPSGSFKWTVNPKDAIQEGGVPLVFPTRQIDYLWRDIPENVMDVVRYRITQSIGRINSTAFDVGFRGGGLRGGFPPGTMLLLGAKEEPTRRTFYQSSFLGNLLLYNVKLSFLYRNNGNDGLATPTYYGWNYLYRGPSYSPQFQLVTHNGSTISGGGVPIYTSAEHGNLFKVSRIGLVF